MRLRKRDLLAVFKSDLPLAFSAERISAHGGLELVRRYFQATVLPGRLREAFRSSALGGDYAAVRMDGAFCQPWMFPFLDEEGVEYAVKLRFASGGCSTGPARTSS